MKTPLNKVLAGLAGSAVATVLASLANNLGLSFPGLDALPAWVNGAITSALAFFGVAYLAPESADKLRTLLDAVLRRRGGDVPG